MKFKCSSKVLVEMVNAVKAVSTNRISMPIIENIRIRVAGENLEMFSTNLAISVKCVNQVEVLSEGEIGLHAKYFGDIIGKLPADIPITFELKNDVAIITGASFKSKLAGIPCDQFPAFVEIIDGLDFTISAKDLKRGLELTKFVASSASKNYTTDGVLFEVKGDSLKMVSTDGRRLSHFSCALANNTFAANAVIPERTATELHRILNDTGDVAITLGENNMKAVYGNIAFTSSLLVNKFPDYHILMKQKPDKKITLDSAELLDAINRVSVLTDERSWISKFTFTSEELELSGERQQIGECYSSVKTNYTGEPFSVSFNLKYWIDFIKFFKHDQLIAEIPGELNRIFVSVANDDSFTHIIMGCKDEPRSEG